MGGGVGHQPAQTNLYMRLTLDSSGKLLPGRGETMYSASLSGPPLLLRTMATLNSVNDPCSDQWISDSDLLIFAVYRKGFAGTRLPTYLRRLKAKHPAA
jgi:hypothetical protein